MKTKSQLLALVVCVVAAASGCKALQAAARGDVKGAVAAGGELAMKMKQADDVVKSRTATECKPIADSEVGWEEERAIGGAVAVALAAKTKSFAIDGDTQADPAALAAQVKAYEGGDKSKAVALPASPKNDLAGYVARVGRNLAGFSGRPDIQWTFGVVDSETPNAFSAPGGYVLVTTGLLKKLNNEAQLAGVLSHEIGHVTGRHALKLYKETKVTQCEVLIKVIEYGKAGVLSELPAPVRSAADFADFFLAKMKGGGGLKLDAKDISGKMVAFLTDPLVEKAIEQGNAFPDEFAADATAFDLMAFAGYDTAEYDALLKSLGGGGGLMEHHPSAADRTAKLEAMRKSNASFGSAKPALAQKP